MARDVIFPVRFDSELPCPARLLSLRLCFHQRFRRKVVDSESIVIYRIAPRSRGDPNYATTLKENDLMFSLVLFASLNSPEVCHQPLFECVDFANMSLLLRLPMS